MRGHRVFVIVVRAAFHRQGHHCLYQSLPFHSWPDKPGLDDPYRAICEVDRFDIERYLRHETIVLLLCQVPPGLVITLHQPQYAVGLYSLSVEEVAAHGRIDTARKRQS